VKGLWLGLMTIRESILKGTLLFFFFFGNAIILLFAFAISSQTEGETFAVTFFGNPIPPPPAGAIGPVEFILYQLFQTSTQSAMFLGIFATAGLIPSNCCSCGCHSATWRMRSLCSYRVGSPGSLSRARELRYDARDRAAAGAAHAQGMRSRSPGMSEAQDWIPGRFP